MKVLAWIMTLGLVTTVPAVALSNNVEQTNQSSIREERYEWHKENLQNRVDRGELSQEDADYMSENFGNCVSSGRHNGYHMGYGSNRNESNKNFSNGMRNGRGHNRQGRGNCHGNY